MSERRLVLKPLGPPLGSRAAALLVDGDTLTAAVGAEQGRVGAEQEHRRGDAVGVQHARHGALEQQQALGEKAALAAGCGRVVGNTRREERREEPELAERAERIVQHTPMPVGVVGLLAAAKGEHGRTAERAEERARRRTPHGDGGDPCGGESHTELELQPRLLGRGRVAEGVDAVHECEQQMDQARALLRERIRMIRLRRFEEMLERRERALEGALERVEQLAKVLAEVC